jgi:hypothetical protein
MKKKIVLIVIASIAVLATIFGIIDYIKLENEKVPIFSIKLSGSDSFKDIYYGLGYKFMISPVITGEEPFQTSKLIEGGFWFFTWSIHRTYVISDYISTISIVEQSDCDNTKKLYYTLNDETRIYTYCLEKIIYNHGIEKELSQALKDTPVIIENLINRADEEETYRDGGSKMYRLSKDNIFVKNNMSILKCNTSDGNKDYYIGNEDMEYLNDFCK